MEQSDQALKRVEWVGTAFSLEPRWTVELNQEQIKQELMTKLPKASLSVEFLAQGAFNRVYVVQADAETFVLRVSLPLDPMWKTASEVATMKWIRYNTRLPIPRVIASQTDQDNKLGFEWILMTKVPGITLADAWNSISLNAKQMIVHHLAVFASKLLERQWRGIGNIYPDHCSPLPKRERSGKVGRIVSMFFYWGDRLQQDVPRGPFDTSRKWIQARLDLAESDCRSVLAKGGDDLEDAQRILEVVRRLKSILSVAFPGVDGPEPSIFHHDDLSLQNIMVDKDGVLTGVIDWECVSAIPLWKACNFPAFLEGQTRKLRPERTNYKQDRHGEPDNLYWKHLMEHEQTLLRSHFFTEIQPLQPLWVETFQKSQLQRDFECALLNSDSKLAAPQINEWIDQVILGRGCHESLCDRLRVS